MNQSIRVQCIQKYDDGSVIGTGEYESEDMGIGLNWRQAIEAAAIASGFGTEVVRSFVLDWANDIERNAT